jgi:eukaryotic-like serine/threonine-protein kinase
MPRVTDDDRTRAAPATQASRDVADDATLGPGRPRGVTVPERIDERWRIVREVARGGMGVVYEATDERTGARCALKVLRTGRTNAAQEERFRREADLGARLGGHPGIVPATALGTLPTGELYCVMEFVEGRSLWDLLRAGGVPREQGVRLVAQVARAVAYAHARDVVHRDLKPQNVLITPDGRARLTDFGIAKALDDVHGLTATGEVMGTPRFMAPEQAEDSKRVDPRTDVFGLGAILYATLTGRPPMELSGLKLREALRRVYECKVAPPRSLDGSIDPAIDALCRRALARDPAHRPQTAAALADELDAWLAGDRTVREPPPQVDAPPEATPGEVAPLPTWLVLLIGLALLAGGIAVGFLAMQ